MQVIISEHTKLNQELIPILLKSKETYYYDKLYIDDTYRQGYSCVPVITLVKYFLGFIPLKTRLAYMMYGCTYENPKFVVSTKGYTDFKDLLTTIESETNIKFTYYM